MKLNPFFVLIGIAVIGFAFLIVMFGSSNQSNTNAGLATNNISNENPGSLQVGVEEGNLAPDFSLITVEGSTVRLSDFKGKYVLFASMATWCTPCKIEAQNVKRFQDSFPNVSLQVMQIDVDPNETSQDLINFRQNTGKNDWIMGFDDGSISQLYNIRTFDTTFIVDPNGKIVYRDNGFPVDTKTLEELIA